MPSTYPTSLDSLSTSHVDSTGEIIHASTINDIADAVDKIEAELGLLPKGTDASVRARLDRLDTTGGGGSGTPSFSYFNS